VGGAYGSPLFCRGENHPFALDDDCDYDYDVEEWNLTLCRIGLQVLCEGRASIENRVNNNANENGNCHEKSHVIFLAQGVRLPPPPLLGGEDDSSSRNCCVTYTYLPVVLPSFLFFRNSEFFHFPSLLGKLWQTNKHDTMNACVMCRATGGAIRSRSYSNYVVVQT
jgi:hypothetical protein